MEKLIEQYGGRFVVIKDEAVLAVYDNFHEAYVDTIKTEELGTFIIQECVRPEDESMRYIWHSVSFGQAVQA